VISSFKFSNLNSGAFFRHCLRHNPSVSYALMWPPCQQPHYNYEAPPLRSFPQPPVTFPNSSPNILLSALLRLKDKNPVSDQYKTKTTIKTSSSQHFYLQILTQNTTMSHKFARQTEYIFIFKFSHKTLQCHISSQDKQNTFFPPYEKVNSSPAQRQRCPHTRTVPLYVFKCEFISGPQSIK
jgi:hypothetical protein